MLKPIHSIYIFNTYTQNLKHEVQIVFEFLGINLNTKHFMELSLRESNNSKI